MNFERIDPPKPATTYTISELSSEDLRMIRSALDRANFQDAYMQPALSMSDAITAALRG